MYKKVKKCGMRRWATTHCRHGGISFPANPNHKDHPPDVTWAVPLCGTGRRRESNWRLEDEAG